MASRYGSMKQVQSFGPSGETIMDYSIYDAIRAVAKEKAYTHVLNKESLLVAPDADDMIAAVAAKLKLSLPKQTGPAAPMK